MAPEATCLAGDVTGAARLLLYGRFCRLNDLAIGFAAAQGRRFVGVGGGRRGRFSATRVGEHLYGRFCQGVASTATQTLVKPARVHSSFNFVQGHVCQDCNNGGMSRLEVAAQPILIPLIDRQRPIASLTTEEKLTVSKWVAKTAYMVSWAAPLEKRVQQDHLMALNGDGGKPFSGVAIFGMQSDFKENFSCFLTGHWPSVHAVKPGFFRSDASRSIQDRLTVPARVFVSCLLARPKISFHASKRTGDFSDHSKPSRLAHLFS